MRTRIVTVLKRLLWLCEVYQKIFDGLCKLLEAAIKALEGGSQ